MKQACKPLPRLAALLLTGLLLVSLFAGCKSDTVSAETGPVTSDIDQLTGDRVYVQDELAADDPRLDNVIATCGKADLTNRAFQIYYYMNFFDYLNRYGQYAAYIGLNPDEPLKDQPCYMEEGLTWEQFFVRSALEQFHQFASISAKAESEGYVLSEEDETHLTELFAGLPEDASDAGYSDVDSYISGSFGPGLTQKDFEEYMRRYFYVVSYEDKMYAAINWTEDDLNTYVLMNPSQFGDISLANINVRHILIKPKTNSESASEQPATDPVSTEDTAAPAVDTEALSSAEASAAAEAEQEAAKAAAKAKAEEILAAYREDPTEEHFAALAAEHTEDPGSAETGGLYEDVAPGKMVQQFNDWCFDAARKPGDVDIVETDYGYHVMYFVGRTDHYEMREYAEEEYHISLIQEQIQAVLDAAPMFVNYPAVLVGPIPMDSAVEEAEASELME